MGQGKNNKKNRNGNQEPERRDDEAKKLKKEIEEKEDNRLEEYSQIVLEDNRGQRKIHLITIIDEAERHENSSGSSKTTKYDHVLPKLAEIKDDDGMDGFLALLNTSGGDMDAGLAIAEMITSLSLPTVSLVLGGSHSIGMPLAMSTSYSFIVPSRTMMIHPVRMTDMVIGTAQTYKYFEMIQDRIPTLMANHVDAAYSQLRDLMHNTKMLTRDLGTMLVEEQAVDAGLISRVDGIREAPGKLYEVVSKRERHR